MGDNFLQDSNGLFQEITRKFGVIGERTQGINRGIDQVNQQVREGLLDLQALRQRVQTIVDRIRRLRGLSQEEKKRIMDMLAALNQQADQILGQVRDLPQDVQDLPREIQIQMQAINDALDEIEGAVTDVESGRGAGGGGGAGAPSRPVVRNEGPPPPDQIDWDEAQRERDARRNPPRQGGGKKRRKTRRKRKGRKGRKTRRGGYVIPNKRTHSAKGKKTPAAGKKTSSKGKKSRK